MQRSSTRRTFLVAALLALAELPCFGEPPPIYFDLINRAHDNPALAIAAAKKQLAQAVPDQDEESRFWLWTGIAVAEGLLERIEDALISLSQAESALASLPQPALEQRLWLETVQLPVQRFQPESDSLILEATQLRARTRAFGEPRLDCEMVFTELWLLIFADLDDEAWGSAEEAELCAKELHDSRLQAQAIFQLGILTKKSVNRTSSAESSTQYFERALATLGNRPARFLRSLIEWETGNSHRGQGELEKASFHYATAQRLSREIGDTVGAAAATLPLAQIELLRDRPDRALPLARESVRLLRGEGTSFRTIAAHATLLTSLARLRHPDVQSELERALRLENQKAFPEETATLMRATAEAYASLGRFEEAYRSQRRASAVQIQISNAGRDLQTLRLRERYETARREAENADLKLRSETARFELAAAQANRRTLSWALAAVVLLLGGAALFTVRTILHRRHLSELALRDELTALPNRRAILALGEEQIQQCRRGKQPLTLALLDLDYFKRANDTHGHLAGDRVLRALATSATIALRGRDAIGRLGGEEFMLVLPGTAVEMLPTIFARLRQSFAATEIDGLPAPHGLTFSLGGAEAAPGSTASLEALMREADRQLYLAKAAGRDTLRFDETRSSQTTVPLTA